MALAILWVSNNLYVIPVPGEARRKININPEMVEFEEDGTFSVPSETKRDVFYSVSMELRTCTTCPQGMLKGPCKHRTVVSLSQNLPSFDVVPELNPEMRKCGCTLGQGSTLISTNSCHCQMWYFFLLSTKNKVWYSQLGLKATIYLQKIEI